MIEKILRTTALCASMFLAVTTAQAADKKEACQLVKVTDLPVAVTPANVVLTAGSIKGNPVQFAVVTGAFDTILDKAAISKFDLTPNYRESTGYNLSGEVKYLHSMIPEITVGPFKITNKVFPIAEEHNYENPVYGTIGQDIFESFDIDLDISKGKISLFQHNTCPSEPVYWANAFSEADLNTPGKIALVQVEINGTPTEALIATDLPRSIITLEFAKRLGINVDSPGVVESGTVKGAWGQALTTYKYRFSELKIGDEVVKNPTLFISDLTPRKFDNRSMGRVQSRNYISEGMILGADFMRQHHIYLATNEKKMYFTWNGGSIFAPPTENAATPASGK